MFAHVIVDIKNLSVLGKNFKWDRPKCPNGCKKVWGHGFVLRYLSGFIQGIYLKRYRCPCCGIVILMFPTGYWRRYQSSIKEIFLSLQSKFKTYKWPPWISRQTAGHWMTKFRRHIFMEYGVEIENLIEKLENLYAKETMFLGQFI